MKKHELLARMLGLLSDEEKSMFKHFLEIWGNAGQIKLYELVLARDGAPFRKKEFELAGVENVTKLSYLLTDNLRKFVAIRNLLQGDMAVWDHFLVDGRLRHQNQLFLHFQKIALKKLEKMGRGGYYAHLRYQFLQHEKAFHARTSFLEPHAWSIFQAMAQTLENRNELEYLRLKMQTTNYQKLFPNSGRDRKESQVQNPAVPMLKSLYTGIISLLEETEPWEGQKVWKNYCEITSAEVLSNGELCEVFAALSNAWTRRFKRTGRVDDAITLYQIYKEAILDRRLWLSEFLPPSYLKNALEIGLRAGETEGCKALYELYLSKIHPGHKPEIEAYIQLLFLWFEGKNRKEVARKVEDLKDTLKPHNPILVVQARLIDIKSIFEASSHVLPGSLIGLDHEVLGLEELELTRKLNLLKRSLTRAQLLESYHMEAILNWAILFKKLLRIPPGSEGRAYLDQLREEIAQAPNLDDKWWMLKMVALLEQVNR